MLYLIQDYANEFGSENIQVQVFEKDKLQDKSIINYFFQLIGIKESNDIAAKTYLNSEKPLFSMKINYQIPILNQTILAPITTKDIKEFEKILYNPI